MCQHVACGTQRLPPLLRTHACIHSRAATMRMYRKVRTSVLQYIARLIDGAAALHGDLPVDVHRGVILDGGAAHSGDALVQVQPRAKVVTPLPHVDGTLVHLPPPASHIGFVLTHRDGDN